MTHPKFHTGKVELPDAPTVDFATARTEFYQYPAALPTAEHSSVREDLYRRDFTINAMAMQLNGEEAGRLLDPFGGSRDLAEGAIRILHNLSFIEDPTRILRAVRFEARFGFRMDERTEELARHAIEMEMLDRLSGERIREELLALFARPYPEIGLRRLDALGVLSALEPSLASERPGAGIRPPGGSAGLGLHRTLDARPSHRPGAPTPAARPHPFARRQRRTAGAAAAPAQKGSRAGAPRDRAAPAAGTAGTTAASQRVGCHTAPAGGAALPGAAGVIHAGTRVGTGESLFAALAHPAPAAHR